MPTNIAPTSPRAADHAGEASAHVRSGAAWAVFAILLLAIALLIAVELMPWFTGVDLHAPFGALRPLLYFTVQSNLIAAIAMVFFAIALLRRRPPSRATEWIRGLATVDLVITGIVNGLMLGNGGDPVLHTALPVAMVVWWVVLPPRTPLSWIAVPSWLIHPVAWLIVVFWLRDSASDHWVPYYFLDPRQGGGWGTVAIYSSAIIAAFVILGALAVLVGKAVPWRARVWRSLRPASVGDATLIS